MADSLIYVGPEGRLTARFAFVGEAPGADEVAQGRPFIGRSGQLLRSTLFALDLQEKEIYITNVVKVRPEGNRTPSTDEVRSWLPALEQELLDLSSRTQIVAVGKTAEWALEQLGIRHEFIYHPAYILRNPAERDKWVVSLEDIIYPAAAMEGSPNPPEENEGE